MAVDWLQQLLQAQQMPPPAGPGQIPTASQEALQKPMIDPIYMLAMLPTMGPMAAGRSVLSRALVSLLANFLANKQRQKSPPMPMVRP
jgi:hypothetical protein